MKTHIRWLTLLLLILIAAPITAQDDADLSIDEIVVQRIAQAKEWESYRVSLRGFDLTEIPSAIFEFEALQELDLAENNLTTLPPELWQMPNLRVLYLQDNNNLRSLPSEISQLQSLEELYAGRNGFTELPPEIGQLVNLREISISNEGFTTLPPEIGQLKNLESLRIVDNQLMTLPPEIGQLDNLRHLNAKNNQLTELPPEIGQLTQLEKLDLGNNQLTTLPSEIKNMTALCFLNLSDNNFRHLPIELGNLQELAGDDKCHSAYSHFFIYNNPLESPPTEVIEAGSVAIINYLQNEQRNQMIRLVLTSIFGWMVIAAVFIYGYRMWQNRRKPKAKNKASS